MTTNSLVVSAYNLNIVYMLYLLLTLIRLIRKKCIVKMSFSLNNWIYNNMVIIQLTVQYRNIFELVPI